MTKKTTIVVIGSLRVKSAILSDLLVAKLCISKSCGVHSTSKNFLTVHPKIHLVQELLIFTKFI